MPSAKGGRLSTYEEHSERSRKIKMKHPEKIMVENRGWQQIYPDRNLTFQDFEYN